MLTELKDFNCGDLEQLDLKEGSDDEKEDGWRNGHLCLG